MSDVPPPAAADLNDRRRLTLATVAGIALATFLVGLILATWAINRFRPAPQPAPTPVAATQPSTKVIVAPPVATDPASLAARQEMLAAQLAALEQRTAAVTGQAANAYGNATRAETLLIVLAARRQINRGLGLAYLEQPLRARFGTAYPNEVTAIIQASRNPVTAEELRLGLDQIGPQLALGPTDSGWGGSFGRLLGSLVVIHRQDTPSPVPSDRLARARRLLGLDQVEAAAEEIGKLPGAAQATGWMTGAKQYVAVRKALNTLEQAAIEGRIAPLPAPAR